MTETNETPEQSEVVEIGTPEPTGPRARRVWPVVLILAGVALIIAISLIREPPPTIEVGVVLEDKIFRGGQPDENLLRQLKQQGVKTIIKLNRRDYEEEKAQCERLGLNFVYLPTDPSTIADLENCQVVNEALDVLTDESQYPIYLHCAYGRDRTGFVVGMYRLRVDGWSWEQIDEELRQYGHDENDRESFPTITETLKQGGLDCPPPAPAP